MEDVFQTLQILAQILYIYQNLIIHNRDLHVSPMVFKIKQGKCLLPGNKTIHGLINDDYACS